jgi:uncharacterized protein
VIRTRTHTRAAALALTLSLTVAGVACSSSADDGDPADTSPAGGGDRTAVLETLADEVIVPSYEALVAALEQLEADTDALCAAPSIATLDTARAAWRDVSTAWRGTRASGIGPARDRRLAASIGFLARDDAVRALLAGSDPVDEAGLASAGAAVKGISAMEIGLFGEGSGRLAVPGDPRRCTYVASVSRFTTAAATAVRDDWTSGYRDTFVEGIDGDLQMSVDAIVNEMIFRVTETDDQGLRALVEADDLDELPANRTDGPADFHIAELQATLAGVAALVGSATTDERVLTLVAHRSADTATRLQQAATAASDAMAALPDSVTDAVLRHSDAVAEAQEAVAALKVLLATEVASELGVTMSFSDADGDS